MNNSFRIAGLGIVMGRMCVGRLAGLYKQGRLGHWVGSVVGQVLHKGMFRERDRPSQMKHAELKNRPFCSMSLFDPSASMRRETVAATPHSACPSAWANPTRTCNRSHVAPSFLSVPRIRRYTFSSGAKCTSSILLPLPLCLIVTNCPNGRFTGWASHCVYYLTYLRTRLR